MRVTELVELAGDASLTGLGGGEPAGAVTGVTLRANQVRPGDLFAALPGSKVHGADFAADALAAGAAAILTDPAGAGRIGDQHGNAVPVLVHADPRGVLGRLAARIYGDPSTRLAVIGVTGTSGKTTTSYLIEAGLSGCGLVTGLIGTVQTRIAGHRLASAFTTPEAPDLQALLALMVERGVTHVAMEVSSHALALGRVDGTRFAVGAFSNLSPEHLDFHRDMEDYFATKARLFDGRSATEVVCVDTEWGRRLVTESTITVSGRRPDQSDTAGRRPDQSDTATTSGQADWWVGDIDVSPTGAQAYTVHGPDGLRLAIGSRLPGRFNAANTALALACVHAAGADVRRAVPAMAEVDVAGRMERVHRGQEFVAIVDYAHKPAAVAAVLDAVRDQHPAARLAIVVGCGGDRDRAKRPVMGAEAASRADLLVVTDDNPRSEDPALIRAAMLAGALDVPPGQRAEVVEIGDRRKAIKAAVDWAQPGDIIVIAGKGHETGQEIRGVKYPFSDREELAGAIDERLAPRGPRGD